MIVSLIVAHGKKREIGIGNRLPWKLSGDLKLFKKNTLGKPVVMGRKTFDSIGKALPNRINIVITRNLEFRSSEDILVFNDSQSVMDWARENEVEELMIIGGSALFESFYSYADRLYLTLVDQQFPNADVFFPEYDMSDWSLKESFFHPQDEKNECAWTFNLLEKSRPS